MELTPGLRGRVNWDANETSFGSVGGAVLVTPLLTGATPVVIGSSVLHAADECMVNAVSGQCGLSVGIVAISGLSGPVANALRGPVRLTTLEANVLASMLAVYPTTGMQAIIDELNSQEAGK